MHNRWLAILIVTGSVFISGCVLAPPRIARGVQVDRPESSETWAAILQREFPIGSDEATLVRRLEAQGFRKNPVARHARYSWGVLPCERGLIVRWTADEAGRLTSVTGLYDLVCL